MTMKQWIAVLGLLLLFVAFAPPAADAQWNSGDRVRQSSEYWRYQYGNYDYYGQPPGARRGGWIGGPHDTYPYDRSAAPCLEDGSFGPNNRFQTPYNGPYGFPGQHPCQFDWASMNRQKQDVRLGWANVLLNVADLAVNIRNGRKIDQARQEQAQNRQQIIMMQQQQMQRERQEPQKQMERPFLRNGEGFIQGITFANDTDCVVTLFNDHLNQQQDVRPGRTTKSLPWRFEDVQAFAFIEGQYIELDLEFLGNRVVITTPEN